MSENEYEYILNPKTGKLVKTCGSVGTKLIKNYEHDEIYNPKTKRNVQFTKTTGQKVYKKYKEFLHKHSKGGGFGAEAVGTVGTSHISAAAARLAASAATARASHVRTRPALTATRGTTTHGTATHGTATEATAAAAAAFGLNAISTSYSYKVAINGKNIEIETASTMINNRELEISITHHHSQNNGGSPPTKTTNKYIFDFECEPECEENLKTILQQLLEWLIAFIDTLVSLLQPTIPNLHMVKAFILDFMLTEAFKLVFKDENLVKVLVLNALGNNPTTITAKLVISTTNLKDYATNLPQIIVKKNVIELLKNPQGLYKKYAEMLQDPTKLLYHVKIYATKLKNI